MVKLAVVLNAYTCLYYDTVKKQYFCENRANKHSIQVSKDTLHKLDEKCYYLHIDNTSTVMATKGQNNKLFYAFKILFEHDFNLPGILCMRKL